MKTVYLVVLVLTDSLRIDTFYLKNQKSLGNLKRNNPLQTVLMITEVSIHVVMKTMIH